MRRLKWSGFRKATVVRQVTVVRKVTVVRQMDVVRKATGVRQVTIIRQVTVSVPGMGSWRDRIQTACNDIYLY